MLVLINNHNKMVLCEAVQLKHPENFVYLCQEWRRVKMIHIVDEVILKTFMFYKFAMGLGSHFV